MEKIKADIFIKKFSSYSLFPGVVKRVMRKPYSIYLDGGDGQFESSRYSFLAIDPFLIFKCWGGRISIFDANGERSFVADPFEYINDLISRYEIENRGEKAPFIGGAAGYIGYDMGRLVEDVPATLKDDLDAPDAVLCFYDSVIIADRLKKELYAAASGLPESGRVKQKYKAVEDLDKLLCFAGPVENKIDSKSSDKNNGQSFVQSNFNREDYVEAVNKVKEHIALGDVYQVNLSQRFVYEDDRSPFDVYESLKTISPAPFSCFLNYADFHVLSSSPESFLKIDHRQVETRPVKGTRPRGKTDTDDIRMKNDLLKSAKDRAELLMITDLERNDLGRVCKYGSINPKALFELETYSNVFHLVSSILGELAEDKSHVDCLKACFPGGSITGAPKIRSMEIIEGLERCRRKIYTGSIGYFGFNQQSEFNIAIRTIIHKDGKYYFSAGGGIVADSDPELEYEETLHKAKGMMEALGVTLT